MVKDSKKQLDSEEEKPEVPAADPSRWEPIEKECEKKPD